MDTSRVAHRSANRSDVVVPVAVEQPLHVARADPGRLLGQRHEDDAGGRAERADRATAGCANSLFFFWSSSSK